MTQEMIFRGQGLQRPKKTAVEFEAYCDTIRIKYWLRDGLKQEFAAHHPRPFMISFPFFKCDLMDAFFLNLGRGFRIGLNIGM